MTSSEQIERAVNGFLQKNIGFYLEAKPLKKGKLILFCIKDFFCTFTIISEEKKNKKIVYEIPYPFSFSINDDCLTFDYTIDSFCRYNKGLYNQFKQISIGKPSKLFNKKIFVKPI
jgi:hypothetical protein